MRDGAREPRPWMCPACAPHFKSEHHPERGCERCGCRERYEEGDRPLGGDRIDYLSAHERRDDD